jgi:hypothetical protein
MNTHLGSPHVRVIIAITWIIFLLPAASIGQDLPQLRSGIIDAREWNFKENRLPLNGRWHFYKQQLLSPEQCYRTAGTNVTVPGLWNDMETTEPLNYGTYYTRVIIPSGMSELTIGIPQLYNSYQLWINNTLIAVNGKTGTTKEETRPQWLPQVVTFDNSHDTLHIVLQISNFYHHKGGIREPLYLGSPELMLRQRAFAAGSNVAEAVILLLESLIFFIVYIRQREKKVLLFFALLCASWAVRSVFSNLYLFTSLWPDFNWTATVKIEYLTLFLIMIWSTLFVNHIFKEVSSNLFQFILIMVNIFFILFTLFTPPVLFSKWLSLFLITAVVALLYGVIVITRAFIQERSGAWFLIIGLVLAVGLMGYDIMSYEGLLAYNIAITNIGYILIFLLITVGLLSHMGIIKSKTAPATTLTYKDLFGDTSSGKRKE